jgi:hypothetical protein
MRQKYDSTAIEGDSGRVTFLVDSSMFGKRNALPREIYGDLDRVVRTDLRYHYSGSVCAHRWLDVCDDPAYGHCDLMDRLDEVLPDLLAVLLSDSACQSNISVTSLGPGDGSVDERILRNLDQEIRLDSYCGLDFSFDLLRRAVHRIAGAKGFRSDFPIRAVCGDFTDLTEVIPGNSATSCIRMFTMTGLTLGNYRESALLGRIRTLMGAGDYLFLDARLHDLGECPDKRDLSLSELDATIGSYNRSSVKRFVFGPVEVATLATADDVEIGYDVTRGLTVVPNALNVVIYCTGLNTRMRLTGESVERDRLDLAVTTMYNHPDLLSWFGSSGFSTLWHRDIGGMAVFLLKRD